eukprot:g3748.t1
MQTSEFIVAQAPSSTFSPTGDTKQTEDRTRVFAPPTRDGPIASTGVASSNMGSQGSSCIGSITSRFLTESSAGHLAVRKNTKDDEACCEECRRFSESSMLCRSYFRAEDSTGRCYLYESP